MSLDAQAILCFYWLCHCNHNCCKEKTPQSFCIEDSVAHYQQYVNQLNENITWTGMVFSQHVGLVKGQLVEFLAFVMGLRSSVVSC